jgi:hypothetical protein
LIPPKDALDELKREEENLSAISSERSSTHMDRREKLRESYFFLLLFIFLFKSSRREGKRGERHILSK